MKLIVLFTFMLSYTSLFSQTAKTRTIVPLKKVYIVEASCGQCQFKMASKGCTLAVRMDGKSFFVDKAKIDDFGDAHSKMGFCNAIRKAKVQGDIVDGKFVATYFELIDKK